MPVRHIITTVKGRAAVDGAGVHLVRVLGYATMKLFDPFLMLDAFDSVNPEDYTAGFPMHPHRGIETVTYLLEGRIDHRDSLGNSGTIHDGCCQWMTAGSGIMHEEMPQASPRMLGLQLWVNLPSGDKMAVPKYNGLERDAIPTVNKNGVAVKVLSGRYEGLRGAMQDDYVKVTFLDLTMPPQSVWGWSPPAGENVFAYIFSGSVQNGVGQAVQDGATALNDAAVLPLHEAALFSREGDIELRAGFEGARLVIVGGKPLEEPVAWGGPIVMNTEEALQEAYTDLRQGTFIKHEALG